MDQTPYSLFELNALVRKSITQCLPDEYWLQAELSDVRTHAAGHCYMEFVQKDPRSNNLVAKARGTVWANIFRLLKPYFEEETGQAFTSGIKVLVKVTVEFHELYGYSLTVVDIDPSYTLGDLARRRREILKQLGEEGVLTLNKELELSRLANRIAVISSATAAGYGDFCDQLQKNAYGFKFQVKLFPSVMQGERVEESIISALNAIHARLEEWDAVVIIRGGGATSDLSGFDTYLLAANCAQFPLPIITGIGHERDDTVIDSVAHTRVKTPTAAAEFLIIHLKETAGELENHTRALILHADRFMKDEHKRLEMMVTKLPSLVNLRVVRENHHLQLVQERLKIGTSNRFVRESAHLSTSKQRIRTALEKQIVRETHRIELFQQQVKGASPELLLQRGYSITFKNGKALTGPEQVNTGDTIETVLFRGKIKSTVNLIIKKTDSKICP